MCVIAAGAGVTAGQALAANVAIVSTAIAAAGTAATIYQSNQNAQLQAKQQKRQMDMQYRQAQNQARLQNLGIMQKHIGDVNAHTARRLGAERNFFYGDEAANSKYVADQLKLKEAKDKAAFKSQNIWAKMIGSKGKVLASGLSGQSIGLLALDAERRAGFALAQENASIRSAEIFAGRQSESARIKDASNKELAASRIGLPVRAPIFAEKPVGIGTDLGFGIPKYQWT